VRRGGGRRDSLPRGLRLREGCGLSLRGGEHLRVRVRVRVKIRVRVRVRVRDRVS